MSVKDRSHELDGTGVGDGQRPDELRRTGLLDSPHDIAFDRLARLAARLAAAPIAVIVLVDSGRQSLVGEYGLTEPWTTRREIPLPSSFCDLVAETGVPLLVPDARLDERAEGSPPVAAGGVAGVPLRTAEGHTVGVLCIIDHLPRNWNASDVEALTELAAAAVHEIGHRQELARRVANEERLHVQLSEIDHRVKNSLAVTRSLLEIQARASDDGFVREQLEEAAARVSTIALVHDRLYGLEATGMVRLDDYLQRLCDDLAISLGLDGGAELLALDVAPVMVPVDRVVSLGLIVTQLVTTAIKHRTQAIAVGFSAGPDGRYLLSVTDAATALCASDAGPATGLGSRLMVALTRQLDGEVSASEDGTVRIRLPAESLA